MSRLEPPCCPADGGGILAQPVFIHLRHFVARQLRDACAAVGVYFSPGPLPRAGVRLRTGEMLIPSERASSSKSKRRPGRELANHDRFSSPYASAAIVARALALGLKAGASPRGAATLIYCHIEG